MWQHSHSNNALCSQMVIQATINFFYLEPHNDVVMAIVPIENELEPHILLVPIGFGSIEKLPCIK